jgi:hypothetical protein
MDLRISALPVVEFLPFHSIQAVNVCFAARALPSVTPELL